MTTWNYRVIRKNCPNGGQPTYQIHEVYYRENGSIDCWTQAPVEPLGTSEPQLRNDVHAFLGAFRMPVLEEKIVRGQSLLVEERLEVRPSRIGKWSTTLQLLTLAVALLRLHDAALVHERVLDAFVLASALATVASGLQYLYRGFVWLQNRASSITPPG